MPRPAEAATRVAKAVSAPAAPAQVGLRAPMRTPARRQWYLGYELDDLQARVDRLTNRR